MQQNSSSNHPPRPAYATSSSSSSSSACAIPTATSLLDTSGEGDEEEEEGQVGPNKNNINSDGSSEEWDSLQQADSRQLASHCLQLEDRNQLLRQKLRDIQRQRRRVRHELQQCEVLDEQLHWQRVAVSCQQQQALEELLACRRQRHGSLEHKLGRTQRWNVLTNDAFHIDVNADGCATINSLRLGALSVVLLVQSASSSSSNQNSAGSREQLGGPTTGSSSSQLSPTTTAAASSAVGAFFSLVGGGGGILSTAQQPHPPSSATLPTANNRPQHPPTPPATKVIRVPWREINAALGQVALLLCVLEQSLAVPSLDNTTTIVSNNNKPILFRYEIQAMGSTSKIGIRPTASSSSAATSFYNLYFAEEGFQLFGRRNFDTALQYLVDCVQSAAEIVQQRHGSIVLPHAVVQTTMGTAAAATTTTIGGLTIHYFAMNNQKAVTEEEHLHEWTRAMKYLLTNVKHLMVYPGLGLWSSN